MGKVVGMGMFFLSKDPKQLQQWYLNALGIELHPEYFFTAFNPAEMAEIKNSAQVFSLMDQSSDYLKPSNHDFMLNFCVDDIEFFIEKLKSKNIDILWQDLQSDQGKFVHICDPEGHKIELWQPV